MSGEGGKRGREEEEKRGGKRGREGSGREERLGRGKETLK